MSSRVLIVAHAEAHAYALATILQKAKFEVVRVGTGAGALDDAIRYKPNVILLDLQLPDTDGYAVALRLKSQPETRSIPIILHSGYPCEEGSSLASDCGAHAFVTYPINTCHLLQVLDEALASVGGNVPIRTSGKTVVGNAALQVAKRSVSGQRRKSRRRDLMIVASPGKNR